MKWLGKGKPKCPYCGGIKSVKKDKLGLRQGLLECTKCNRLIWPVTNGKRLYNV
jgi:predicted Zn finger-like uncharacterized protein